jgi:hypothetical protein
MKCQKCSLSACACLFAIKNSDGTGICKKCAGAPLPFEQKIEMEQALATAPAPKVDPSSQPASPKIIVHFGAGAGESSNQYADFVRRTIEVYGPGYSYQGFGLDCDFRAASDVIKRAAMVLIWNGLQGKSPLAARLCQSRGIPHAFFEWGMLPQGETFFVDPSGFCGDSILNGALHWVSDLDRAHLANKRAALQAQYPRQDEGFVLVPLQVEADTQVLFHTPYNTMEELIEHVEAMYPNQRIVVRPHPSGGKKRRSQRAEIIYEGQWLDWARRASVVVGLTSTCLFEAGVLGVPVVALGDHPLRSHSARERDDLLAGALALSVSRSAEMSGVLARFGIKPL